jgi:catechol 2,3-dioxygenase-like lactoylglutathione lyase family enzyme
VAGRRSLEFRNLRLSLRVIQHVTREIPPSKLEECIAFYALLGFKQVTAPEGIRGRAAWLERVGEQIHLMWKEDAVPERGHVGVVVEDYSATLARLRTEGHEVDPRREHWGSPRAYVRDPAGHLVELMAWGPSDQPPGT